MDRDLYFKECARQLDITDNDILETVCRIHKACMEATFDDNQDKLGLDRAELFNDLGQGITNKYGKPIKSGRSANAPKPGIADQEDLSKIAGYGQLAQKGYYDTLAQKAQNDSTPKSAPFEDDDAQLALDRAQFWNDANKPIRGRTGRPIKSQSSGNGQKPGLLNHQQMGQLSGYGQMAQKGYYDTLNTTANKDMSKEKVKKAQEFLKSKGYNISVDGIWGKQTSAAWKDYKSKQGGQSVNEGVEADVSQQQYQHYYSPDVKPGGVDAQVRHYGHNPNNQSNKVIPAYQGGVDAQVRPTQPSKEQQRINVGTSPQEIMMIQEHLRQAGYNIKVDGIWGKQTSAAFKDYHRPHSRPK